MLQLIRTNFQSQDFQKLVTELDRDLAIRDGAEHSFYAPFNKITALNHVIILYENGLASGCGAFKPLTVKTVEIKRMFVTPPQRGKGLAGKILLALEAWALESGFEKARLETGKKQPEAIALYIKNSYKVIPNYGQYAGIENSICFEKIL